jgi:hypothetical protein
MNGPIAPEEANRLSGRVKGCYEQTHRGGDRYVTEIAKISDKVIVKAAKTGPDGCRIIGLPTQFDCTIVNSSLT